MTPPPLVVIEETGPPWLAAADTCLDPAEEIRAARFRHPEHRDIWRAGRAWVRHQLATTLATSPAAVTFTIDPRDRPRVAGAPAAFDANWSHAGRWMALAVSRHSPVGIDIELVRPEFPHLDVEASVCTATERAALDAAPDPESRGRLFFRLWTAKEALMKATGLGAAMDPAGIDVRLAENRPAGYSSHPGWLVRSTETAVWTAAWTWPV